MKTTMKMLACMVALLFVVPAVSYAQKSDKELKKDAKSKVLRDNRKIAKQLTKEGWKVMPGKLSIERQLQEAQYAELDEMPDGQKRFFVGTHSAVGGNYSAAKQIADNRARLELAQSVNSQVAQKIKEQLANKDFGEGDIQLIDEFVSANQSLVSAQLNGVTPVLEIYRELDKGQNEVRVVVKMEAAKALKAAREALRPGLKEKAERLAEELDQVLPY